jgi:hypothetical protein
MSGALNGRGHERRQGSFVPTCARHMNVRSGARACVVKRREGYADQPTRMADWNLNLTYPRRTSRRLVDRALAGKPGRVATHGSVGVVAGHPALRPTSPSASLASWRLCQRTASPGFPMQRREGTHTCRWRSSAHGPEVQGVLWPRPGPAQPPGRRTGAGADWGLSFNSQERRECGVMNDE